MSRRLLLFDIDGTLIRSRGLGRVAIDRAFADLWGWTDASDGIRFDGRTDPWIVSAVFARHGRSPDEARAAQPRFLERYRHHIADVARERADWVEVLPGVLDLLAHLDAHDPSLLGLLTGNIQAGARAKLDACDLWSRFALGAFGDEAPRREDLLPVALERAQPLGGADQVVVIGDTPHDVAVARAHGARAVAVATGSSSLPDLAATHPDALLPDLSDLPAALAALG